MSRKRWHPWHDLLRPILYRPPKWIVSRFEQEDRMVFGFWTFVFSVAGVPFFGKEVLYVTILSCVALIPNFTSETPVKVEATTAEVEHADTVEVNGE